MDNLRIAHLNIRSLYPSLNVVRALIEIHSFGVVGITETWLDQGVRLGDAIQHLITYFDKIRLHKLKQPLRVVYLGKTSPRKLEMQAQVVCLGRVQQLKFSVPKIVVAFLDSKAVHLDKIQCLEILISVFDTAAPPNTNNLPTTSHSVVESGGKTNGSKRSSGSLHIDDPRNAEVIKLIETKFTKLERSL
ncbi:hypothetical protein HHI36_015905 [Cryptolaemus montrouzieri]|uniref:Uncharacterized protein n=1 Tax=Cryptolaemus montrouzieri TaxID=559131 RepID=A0ABD2N7G5_9CUCU